MVRIGLDGKMQALCTMFETGSNMVRIGLDGKMRALVRSPRSCSVALEPSALDLGLGIYIYAARPRAVRTRACILPYYMPRDRIHATDQSPLA